MSGEDHTLGTISWFDLTIDDAQEVRDFYEQVVGWSSSPVSMGDYDDFTMQTPSGQTVAGICHARGENAKMPAQWMLYVKVANLDESIATCEKMGGQVVCPPRKIGEGRCAVVQDPAGASVALYEEFES